MSKCVETILADPENNDALFSTSNNDDFLVSPKKDSNPPKSHDISCRRKTTFMVRLPSAPENLLLTKKAQTEDSSDACKKRKFGFSSQNSFSYLPYFCNSEEVENNAKQNQKANLNDRAPKLLSKSNESSSSDNDSNKSGDENLGIEQSRTSILSADNSPEEQKSGKPLSEFRARLKTCASGWILLLSIPRLVMLAHLQNLVASAGGSGKQKAPSIQPNEYMDNLLKDIKSSMKERGLNNVELPDQEEFGVSLYKGKMKGLTNVSRDGDASLEAATDHFLLIFTLQAKDIKAGYFWKKNRLKGEVTASVNRIVMKMEIKQVLPHESPPELIAFKVVACENVRVTMQGLGQPLNWIVKKMLSKILQRYLRDVLEKEAKSVIQQELDNVTETDLLALPLGFTSIKDMLP